MREASKGLTAAWRLMRTHSRCLEACPRSGSGPDGADPSARERWSTAVANVVASKAGMDMMGGDKEEEVKNARIRFLNAQDYITWSPERGRPELQFLGLCSGTFGSTNRFRIQQGILIAHTTQIFSHPIGFYG